MSSTRSFLKVMIHHALDLVDQVKRVSAETVEHCQDLLAEVEAEREAERRRRKAEAREAGDADGGEEAGS